MSLPDRVYPTLEIDGSGNILHGSSAVKRVWPTAASVNATVVKATPGCVSGWICYNDNAAVNYLKLYNKATAPAPATDTALLIATIPLLPDAVTVGLLTNNIPFSTGIGFAVVTGVADADATGVSTDVYIQVLYS